MTRMSLTTRMSLALRSMRAASGSNGRSIGRRRPAHARTLVAAILAVVVVAGCSGGFAPGGSDGAGAPLRVLGAENFYGDVLSAVGGPQVTVTSLLNDPNADPHAFESSPRAAAAVADARLVVLNGLGYDDFARHLLDAAPDPAKVVIDVQQLLGVPDGTNPHLWYDPATMPAVVTAVTRALSTLDPAHAADYASRAAAYEAQLQTVAERIARLRATYAGLPVAFTEDVAGPMTAAIGLVVRTPPGFMKAVEDGIDPSPADVATELDLISGRAVRALLYNSQVISPITREMNQLAEEKGVPVVAVTETMPAQYPSFAAWQLAQLDDLERALRGGE
jgi:zinc/manganese transport system substrate-binding protein